MLCLATRVDRDRDMLRIDVSDTCQCMDESTLEVQCAVAIGAALLDGEHQAASSRHRPLA